MIKTLNSYTTIGTATYLYNSSFNTGHVETETMQTADCTDCADWVLFFYLYVNILVKFLL